MPSWPNRITSSGTVDPRELEANVMNWRQHPMEQRKALEAILNQIGWVQAVVVNQNTGRLIDGHLRVLAAIDNGEAEIPVTYVDLSEDEERLALATFDSIARLASTNDDVLSELLSSLVVEDEDLLAFLHSLEEDEEDDVFEGVAIPEPEEEERAPTSSVGTLTIVVTPDQKSVILEALDLAAGGDSVSQGEALSLICRAYLDVE